MALQDKIVNQSRLAKEASRSMNMLSTITKNNALLAMARALEQRSSAIL